MASLDSLKTECLVKEVTTALEELEVHFPHPWGRSLVELLQHPEIDRETYDAISNHLLNEIQVWDDLNLKKFAEETVFWYYDRSDLASYEPADWHELNPICTILSKSEWIWSQVLKSEALDPNRGDHKDNYISVAQPVFAMFIRAPATFTESKEFVLKVLEKVPLLFCFLETELIYDPAVILTVMASADECCFGLVLPENPMNMKKHLMYWDEFHQNLKEELDTFALFRQTFVPHVLKSELNQGEETTLMLLGVISDFIGLPSKSSITACIKADAKYEALQPYLRTVPGDAPCRSLKKRDRSREDPPPLHEVICESGNHLMQSPLLPLNRRGVRRQRKPVDRFTFDQKNP